MTKVVIVGAGKGGRALLEMFVGDRTVSIVGVADVNPWSPGLELARRLNIPVATDLRELIADPRLDLIIDVTGNPEVHRTIHRLKAQGTEVMGGASAKFMWDLLAERKRSEELEDRYSLMLRELQAQAEGDFIMGQNPKMKEVAELIARVAPAPTTVLIRGESGTGKELVARAIHRYSHLRDKPLVTVNCTALTPTLMESELFGHKRGAFTGAVTDKAGLFEKADGGTIFLDEVGDMPLEMQGKLLRVLQAGESKPVGDVVTRKVRVRVIAATNRDLERALEAGEFRDDLFYRFNAFTITLPPLRERAEDIPVLAYHFLRKAEAKVNTGGIYSPLDAQIAERAGMKSIYFSGYSLALLNGWPDMGLLTMTEVTKAAAMVASAVEAPIIADADDGYGNALSTMRTVQEFVRTGVAGIHIEDQRFPKRCGHIAGKTIVSREEALGKYRAALETRDRLDRDFVVIARTDAYGAVGGSLEEAIWRGRAYADAGVDSVWCELSNASREPAIAFARAMRETHPDLPLSFNYSSSFRWHQDANPLTFRELGELGYRFIFITLFGAHAAMHSVWNHMHELAKNEEAAQWGLERLKAGHPTESHHVMARVSHFQELERRFVPGTDERLKGSDGFGDARH